LKKLDQGLDKKSSRSSTLLTIAQDYIKLSGVNADLINAGSTGLRLLFVLVRDLTGIITWPLVTKPLLLYTHPKHQSVIALIY
jgi:hypothetical protein